jgi:hypothetical protein
MHYNICEVSTSLVTPPKGGMLNNILSYKIGTISITCANITLIIYLAYISLNVNITKNYFPKPIKSIVTYFDFITYPNLHY